MLVYIILSLFLFLCAVAELRVSRYVSINNKIIFFLLSFFVILLTGLRTNIDTDFSEYHLIFNMLDNNSIGYTDYGYILLMKFYKTVFNNSFQGFVFFIAVCSLGIKLWLVSRLDKPFLAFLFYISSFLIMCEWNAIRQGIAITVLIFAGIHLNKGNKKYFILLTIIASFFHRSSLLFFLIYFFRNTNISLRKFIIFYLFSIVINYVFINFVIDIIVKGMEYFSVMSQELSKRIIDYTLQKNTSFISFGAFKRFIFIFFYFLLTKNKKKEQMHLNSCIIGLLIFQIFMGFNVFTSRLPLIFEISYIYLFGSIEYDFSYGNLLIAVLLISMLTFNFFSSLYGSVSIPYQTIFSVF